MESLDDALDGLDEALNKQALEALKVSKAAVDSQRSAVAAAAAAGKQQQKSVHAADEDDASDSGDSSDEDRRPARPGPPAAGRKTYAAGGGDDDDDILCSNTCCAIFVGVLAVLVGALMYVASRPVDPLDRLLDTRVVQFRGDGVLRTVVYAGQVGGAQPGVTGPNGRDTDWAVFFYKPYCGACQRVWPAFRALGATANTSGRLRFGEVDCVADRHVCSMLKAEKHPVVRIYRAKPPPSSAGGGAAATAAASSGKKATLGFRREPAREWSGLLIAYELVDWFMQLQHGDDALLPSTGIDWPSPEELGAAIRRFKARGKTQHESSLSKRPADPAGYLVDAEAALAYGLVDHVFPHAGTPLAGERLQLQLQWLDLQSVTFPKASVRARLAKLHERLKIRDKWQRDAYEVAVRSHGFSTAPPKPGTWKWCAPDRRWGRGGYSCGLWVLLHTTLSNCNR